MKVLIVIGTRPEAIKMAPVLKSMQERASFKVELCVSGQHREMLDQVLDVFGVTPDYDLDLMTPGQALDELHSRLVVGLSNLLSRLKPDIVLVHGDTSTSFVAAWCAFCRQIPVGHVEAGLRTGDLSSPWPEEGNRKMIAAVTSYHFAPTKAAMENLLREGIDNKKIVVTGNTVIDALLMTRELVFNHNRLEKSRLLSADFSFLNTESRIILVTGHRRENFGDGIMNICKAIRALAEKYREYQFVYPVHLNPNVQKPVRELIGDLENVFLIQPLGYLDFVYLMNASYLILTDSGGIQEEAPSLNKPVLVMRNTTERPEAVDAHVAKLVGATEKRIVSEVSRLLDDEEAYAVMADGHNPFGDGTAAEKICDFMEKIPSLSPFDKT